MLRGDLRRVSHLLGVMYSSKLIICLFYNCCDINLESLMCYYSFNTFFYCLFPCRIEALLKPKVSDSWFLAYFLGAYCEHVN